MHQKNLLTVGIISYNRPIELLRTIKSLLPLPLNVEVVICDDKSPKICEIKDSILDTIKINQKIHFINNETNLGYDKNLFNVIERSNSEYVLLLGDDDYLESGALSNLINFINSTVNFKCGFLKFKRRDHKLYSRDQHETIYYNNNFICENGSFIYNSILFSGLIYHKDSVVSNKHQFIKYFNSIYIQVAIFINLNSKFGSYFIKGPGVIIGGDGESGFGFNEASSDIDLDLKDRTSIISNLAYHKRLFKVIRNVETDININLFNIFIKEYKIRSIKALFNAKKYGAKYLKSYWEEYKKLNIPGTWIILPFYFVIYIIPSAVLNYPIYLIEFSILKYRKFIIKV